MISIPFLRKSVENIWLFLRKNVNLKSNKIPSSLEDLYIILRALEDVFMLSYVREYSKPYKKSEFSKSKIYLFDVGYVHFLSRESEDYGRILENIVFIELFRRDDNINNKNIFYYKSKKDQECDFVLLKKGKIDMAIQVSYELNDKNRDREINGLMAAMSIFKLNEGLILTFDQTDVIRTNGKIIKVMSVWKWLLSV